jgi:two-component system chemotaxis response regulator CheY
MQRTTVRTQRAADAVPSSPPLRVLVAEPDPDTRALYQTALPLAGCEVIEASDGRDALTKALVEPPTLIISELRLPLVDGYALCEILRRDAATRSVPILIETAEARAAAQDRIRQAGADAVLVKPTPPEAVLSVMRNLLTRSADGRASSASDARMPHSSANTDTDPDECRTVLSKSHQRFTTTTPPAPPPTLTCPSCDQSLRYDYSYVGGVSNRHSEQWDYYTCSTCGPFQYRPRTRKLRRVENG